MTILGLMLAMWTQVTSNPPVSCNWNGNHRGVEKPQSATSAIASCSVTKNEHTDSTGNLDHLNH